MSAPDKTEDSIRKIIHDLNGELFLIRGNTEFATDAVAKDSPARQHLDNIMERTEEINVLVQRLREKQFEYEGKPKS